MKKKLFVGVLSLAAVAGGVAGLSAFEAHVINVTAQIENALRVTPENGELDFGTVFPQEQLDERISVALSESFINEDRVDDVEYVIRQKPKCAWVAPGGEEYWGPTQSGHVVIDASGEEPVAVVECPAEDNEKKPQEAIAANAVWGPLPLLCPYLSKHKADEDAQAQEVEVDAFHQPWTVVLGDNPDTPVVEISYIKWTEAVGYLSELASDIVDDWTIDLKVPCFGDNCAQDWEDFVFGINPEAIADDFVLDEELEHNIFGCDLWIEVTGVSETPLPPVPPVQT